MPRARTTKAKSRVDKYYDLKENLDNVSITSELELDIEMERLGSKILELHHVCKSFQHKVILDKFSYKFKKGDRVGLVGPNGSGKTTILKIFTGGIRTDQGKVIVGDTVRFGYYEQDGLVLSEDKRVIDVVRSIADYIPLKKGKKLSAESLLERFLFPRPQQQVYVSQLSGGERRRLYLLTILMKNPNFIILDEPTNDLDLVTLNILEEFLMDFEGVLLIVTHDRFFMDRLVHHVFALQENGEIRDFPGNYTQYREALLAEKYTQDDHQESKITDVVLSESKNYQSNKKELQKIERQLEKLQKEKSSLHDYFITNGFEDSQFNTNQVRLEELNKIIEELEDKWIELS